MIQQRLAYCTLFAEKKLHSPCVSPVWARTTLRTHQREAGGVGNKRSHPTKSPDTSGFSVKGEWLSSSCCRIAGVWLCLPLPGKKGLPRKLNHVSTHRRTWWLTLAGYTREAQWTWVKKGLVQTGLKMNWTTLEWTGLVDSEPSGWIINPQCSRKVDQISKRILLKKETYIS